MTTDYRALCTELVDIITAHANPDDYAVGYVAGVLTRARAALAGEPAVPEGRDLLDFARNQEPWKTWMRSGGCLESAHCEIADLLSAVLSRWGNPAPQPPAEGEVAELVQHLHHAAEVDDWEGASPEWCQSMLRAADLLQRLSPPQPVPVSERPWEREGWCDEEGRCWMGRPLPDAPDRWDWSSAVTGDNATHCLPHDTQLLPTMIRSLPLPGQEAE